MTILSHQVYVAFLSRGSQENWGMRRQREPEIVNSRDSRSNPRYSSSVLETEDEGSVPKVTEKRK